MLTNEFLEPTAKAPLTREATDLGAKSSHGGNV